MNREPLAVIAAISSIVGVLISSATEFGLELTAGQQGALNKLLIAAVGLFTVLFARPKVTPVVPQSNTEALSGLVGETPEEQAVLDKIISRGK
jgi:hypothetical protein